MPTPIFAQGSLNRLRGSVTFPQFPELNITAPFLGPEGINMAPDGSTTDIYDTMTGTVTSPAPYQRYTIDVELLKTQSFSDLFKSQIEDNAVIGLVIVRIDSPTLSNYQINNCAIVNASPGRLNGKNVGFMITLSGYYLVNAALYDAG